MSDNRELQADDFFFLAENEAPQTINVPANDAVKLDDLEREAVQRALDKHEGNISKAAKELGLSRGALYRRLEKYEL